MQIYRLILCILILSLCSSTSWGGGFVNNQKMTSADKIVKQADDSSEKLKLKHKHEIITEQEAIEIAKEYRKSKKYEVIYDNKNRTATEKFVSDNYKYSYEVDWDHPRTRLEFLSLKKDGSLSGGFGKKVLVWHIWFLPLDGVDLEGTRKAVSVDINAKTGEVFTKYSLDKL